MKKYIYYDISINIKAYFLSELFFVQFVFCYNIFKLNVQTFQLSVVTLVCWAL